MKRVTAGLKRQVAKRANGLCEYCRTPEEYSPDSFSAEHILPQSAGGKTSRENLAFSCQGCNNHKYNKTQGYDPVSEALVPLYNPRYHEWSEHFTWSEDFASIVGITAIGRATVEALQLNRKGVVNLRRVLYSVGAHPSERRTDEIVTRE